MQRQIEAGVIVPSLFVPSEIAVNGEHSGRRPAYVPGTTPISRTTNGAQETLPAGTSDSSGGVNDLPESSSPEVSAIAGLDESSAVDEPVRWPDEMAESAFLADQPTQLLAVVAVEKTPKSTPEVPRQPLPPLQELIDQIPLEAREVLEDLFRARFVNVRYAETNAER